jgi:DNA primase
MADVIQLLSILDNVLGSHAPQQQNEYAWFCPFCSHHRRKLAVNVAMGQWHCWVCNTKGRSLFSLLKRMNASKKHFAELAAALDQKIKFDNIPKEVVLLTLPMGFIPLWESSRSYEYKNALAYLHRRNVTLSDIMKYQIGYCETGEFANRIIIPSYDETGKLNYFVGRSYYESTMPYRNPHVSKNIVGFESLISWKFPIVICEGPMDAIAIRRNAIPLFGKSMQSKVLEAITSKGVTDVYLALDADARSDALRIAQTLLSHEMSVYLVKIPGKDPGMIGFGGMIEAIRNTTSKLTFGDLTKERVALL